MISGGPQLVKGRISITKRGLKSFFVPFCDEFATTLRLLTTSHRASSKEVDHCISHSLFFYVLQVMHCLFNLEHEPLSIPALTFHNTVLFVSLALLLWTIYGVIYRLYLSPIAHIPGPWFAKLTFWNEFYYDVWLGGKYTWVIPKYHQQYGQ